MPKLAIAPWLHGYDRSNLTFDIIAGLTVWALVAPQSIAYAQIAGAHQAVRDILIRGEKIGAIARIPRFLTLDDALATLDDAHQAVPAMDQREEER